ncbi:MAG: endonuclease domain-containing protein [Elusimicrobiota bacterium]
MKRKNIERSRALRKKQTDTEKKLWRVLRNRQLSGVKFKRQVPVQKYILDFYSSKYKLAIEADGGQHYEEKNIIYDTKRTNILNNQGIEILRFSDRDILKNIEGVCQVIERAIFKRRDEAPSP